MERFYAISQRKGIIERACAHNSSLYRLLLSPFVGEIDGLLERANLTSLLERNE